MSRIQLLPQPPDTLQTRYHRQSCISICHKPLRRRICIPGLRPLPSPTAVLQRPLKSVANRQAEARMGRRPQTTRPMSGRGITEFGLSLFEQVCVAYGEE